MKTIRVKNVRLTVDDDTYNYLRGEKLSVTKTGSVYYHGRYKKHSLGKLLMHIIFEDNLLVVHKNGDKTDFRLDNLEIISKGEIMRRAGIPFTLKEDDDDDDEENKGKIK